MLKNRTIALVFTYIIILYIILFVIAPFFNSYYESNKLDIILCLGDSITEDGGDKNGWTSLLSYHYSRKLDLINRGYSGYNSRWILQRVLKEDIPHSNYFNIKLVTILLGANDATFESSSPQGLSLTEFRYNIEEIIKYFKKQDSSIKFILITPPMIDEEALRIRNEKKGYKLNRSVKRTKLFADTILNISAVTENCIGIDLYRNTIDDDNINNNKNNKYLSDGLHLNELGNKVLVDLVEECIAKHFPKLASNQIKMRTKSWREIEPFV